MSDPGPSISTTSRWREKARALLHRALSEHATPRGIGLSTALGVFVAMSPLVGLHMPVAAVLATALRLNRALAVLVTNVSVGPIVALIVVGEVTLGSKLLGRSLPPLTLAHAFDVARDALGAWWLGFGVVGPSAALVGGTLAYGMARWREARHHDKIAAGAATTSATERAVSPPA